MRRKSWQTTLHSVFDHFDLTEEPLVQRRGCERASENERNLLPCFQGILVLCANIQIDQSSTPCTSIWNCPLGILSPSPNRRLYPKAAFRRPEKTHTMPPPPPYLSLSLRRAHCHRPCCSPFASTLPGDEWSGYGYA